MKSANGAIGIGNSNPSYTLDVNGSARFTSDVNCANDIFIGGITQTDASSYKKVYLPSTAEISSIGGVCWVVNRIDELEPPRYFQTYQELVKFKGGLSE